jgi:hypothetical protein
MLEKISSRLLQTEPMRRCRLDECQGACCLHGAWIDRIEADDLLANAEWIIPFLPEPLREPALWFDGRCETDPHALSGEVVHTTVLPDADHYGGSACIFSLHDHKCALQAAGIAAGEHPWRYKPFYCILHPLDLDGEGRITLATNEALLAEPASCLRTCSEAKPLAVTFEPELVYLLGETAYRELLANIKPKQ